MKPTQSITTTNLGEGAIWPTSCAPKKSNAADETQMAEFVQKAVS